MMSRVMNCPKTGTTIVACAFDGGVVIGADTRMTTGQYIVSRACGKIARLYENVYLCRSGVGSHCQIVSDIVNSYAEQHALALDESPTVNTIANLARMLNYQNRHLVSWLIVGGWDKHLGGQVYSVTGGGTLMPVKWMVDGSGSTYIWGICDAMFKSHLRFCFNGMMCECLCWDRDGMSQSEAEDFVKSALCLAMTRDGGSGGMCRLVTITENGSVSALVEPKDIPLFPGDLPMPFTDTVMAD